MFGSKVTTAQITSIHGAVIPVGTRLKLESINLNVAAVTAVVTVQHVSPVAVNLGDDYVPFSDRHTIAIADLLTAFGQTAPAQGAGLVATAGQLKATLGWTAVPGATYEVQHDSVNTFVSATTIRDVQTNALVVSPLAAALRYFRFRVVKDGDIGDWSVVASCTPTA